MGFQRAVKLFLSLFSYPRGKKKEKRKNLASVYRMSLSISSSMRFDIVSIIYARLGKELGPWSARLINDFRGHSPLSLSLSPLLLLRCIQHNAIWLAATNFPAVSCSARCAPAPAYFMHVSVCVSQTLPSSFFFFFLPIDQPTRRLTEVRNKRRPRCVKCRLSHPGGRPADTPCVCV